VPRDDDLARWIRRGSCVVGKDGAGRRLDRYLAQVFPYRSRTSWAGLIRVGRIRLNELEVRPGRSLKGGDRIDYRPDPRPEPRVSRSFRVIYEDPEILAVRKPANLPVHPSGRYFRNTLLSLLLESRGEDLAGTDLRIIHRLDRETSGVILFGKGKSVAAALSTQFERREVRKEYLAIVHGSPMEDRFLIDRPIGRDPTSPVRKAMGVLPAGRPSRTGIRVLRRGPEHSLLVARPYTGRLHEIRVHLRTIGHPILGDKVYGLDSGLFLRFVAGALSPEDRARLGWPRQALHAWKLTFQHPRSRQTITLRAPVGSVWIRRAAYLGLGR